MIPRTAAPTSCPASLLLLLSLATASADVAVGQNLNVTLLAQFPPATNTTYSDPPGTQPQAEYSMCTGQSDPITGEEFAIAGAQNGYFFVHTTVPAHSNDLPTGATMDTWFFEDPPSIRWRGVKSFRDYVYAVQPTHSGIRRFRIDASASGAQRVVDLGYSNNSQLAWGGQRLEVDADHGHLYVPGFDNVKGQSALCIYDIFDETAGIVIDPPQLIAAWSPGGSIHEATSGHSARVVLVQIVRSQVSHLARK